MRFLIAVAYVWALFAIGMSLAWDISQAKWPMVLVDVLLGVTIMYIHDRIYP